TGKTWHVCGGFPSASGKTNLAMMLAPDALGDRYHVTFYGDDIAWLRMGEDGKIYGINPENGVFGVAKDTNEATNPTAVRSIAEDYETPQGVPIDAIIFGGRTRDREPLIRAITDLAEGVYDGLTLGAEATFAAEGTEGVLRYDPMSMRPFMATSEAAYAAHWL